MMNSIQNHIVDVPPSNYGESQVRKIKMRWENEDVLKMTWCP